MYAEDAPSAREAEWIDRVAAAHVDLRAENRAGAESGVPLPLRRYGTRLMTDAAGPTTPCHRGGRLAVCGSRQELAQLQRSITRGFNVAIRGEPGVGMSSLLHQLAYRERAHRHIVYVDGEGTEDSGELVEHIRRVVTARPEAYGYVPAQTARSPPLLPNFL